MHMQWEPVVANAGFLQMNICRQCFREKSADIGFNKVRSFPLPTREFDHSEHFSILWKYRVSPIPEPQANHTPTVPLRK